MKALLKKSLVATAVALPVLFFVSCTADLPPVVITANGDVYSVEEFEELEAAGLIDEMIQKIGEVDYGAAEAAFYLGEDILTKITVEITN